jgi:hypothetical protein
MVKGSAFEGSVDRSQYFFFSGGGAQYSIELNSSDFFYIGGSGIHQLNLPGSGAACEIQVN